MRSERHTGWSPEMRMMKPMCVRRMGGLPISVGRDLRRQKSLKPLRCHPITVSGLTMTRGRVQSGQSLRRATQNTRSLGPESGAPVSPQADSQLLSQGRVLQGQSSLEHHGRSEESGDFRYECENHGQTISQRGNPPGRRWLRPFRGLRIWFRYCAVSCSPHWRLSRLRTPRNPPLHLLRTPCNNHHKRI
jgi:hypothetical protein